MNLRGVVDFIHGHKCLSRYVLPAVGHVDPPRPVLGAASDGASRLALAVAALVMQDGSWATVGAYVHEIIPFPNGTPRKIRLVVDARFPQQAIDIAPIAPEDTQLLAQWETAHRDFDDDDSAQAQLKGMAEHVADAGAPLLQAHHKFVRWSEWDGGSGDLRPYGVLLVAPDGRLHAATFPGAEAAAQKWARWDKLSESELTDLPERVSRTVRLSTPETIKSEGWDDAPERALHKFGAEYYTKTGRTMFP